MVGVVLPALVVARASYSSVSILINKLLLYIYTRDEYCELKTERGGICINNHSIRGHFQTTFADLNVTMMLGEGGGLRL